MIIPCMNSTSAAELGGSLPRIDCRRARVSLPAAPGCTTTGAVDAGSCAQTGNENMLTSVAAATIPLRNTATLLAVRSLCLHLECKDFMYVEGQALSA